MDFTHDVGGEQVDLAQVMVGEMTIK
jgi:hypothetical protein